MLLIVGMKTSDNIHADYENAIWHSEKDIINLSYLCEILCPILFFKK